MAAWRLYRELGVERALAFADSNRLRDAAGRSRAFHDPRTGQGKERTPLSESPLFSEESGFAKAKRRVTEWIADKMPWEVIISSDAGTTDANDDPRLRLPRKMLKKLELHDVLPEQHTQIVHHQGEWRYAEPVEGGHKLKVLPKGSKGAWTEKKDF